MQEKYPWLHVLDAHKIISCECPCDRGKRKIGDMKNLGRKSGRIDSFPLLSISYVEDVDSIVNSGLYWEMGKMKPQLRCIGCDIIIHDWVPGSDADFIHRSMNPYCFWMDRRDAGENMEIDLDFNYRLLWPCSDKPEISALKIPRLSPPQPFYYLPSSLEEGASIDIPWSYNPSAAAGTAAAAAAADVMGVASLGPNRPYRPDSPEDVPEGYNPPTLELSLDKKCLENLNGSERESYINICSSDAPDHEIERLGEVGGLPLAPVNVHFDDENIKIDAVIIQMPSMSPSPLRPVQNEHVEHDSDDSIICIEDHVGYWVDNNYNLHLLDSLEMLPPSIYNHSTLDVSICMDEK